jgi:hypothetical protein
MGGVTFEYMNKVTEIPSPIAYALRATKPLSGVPQEVTDDDTTVKILTQPLKYARRSYTPSEAELLSALVTRVDRAEPQEQKDLLDKLELILAVYR